MLRALGRRAPDLRVQIRSAAPARLFLAAMPIPLEIAHQVNDVGVVQSDALTLDGAATLRSYAEFQQGRDAIIDAEVESIRRDGVDLIFGDIPPMASAVGRRAGVPSVAMGNFDWEWIYGEWADEAPEAAHVIDSIRTDYGATDLLLRLPCHDEMLAFPRRVDVPLVGRRAALDRDEARRRAGIPKEARAVLLSFGGMGLGEADLARLARDRDHHYLTVGDIKVVRGTHLEEWELQARGLLYEDLVGAVDVVVTKPGYGIVSECAVNRSAMLYTRRGAFREYPILVREMQKYFPAAYVDSSDLRRGELVEPLRELAALPWPESPPSTDGAEVVAGRVLDILERSIDVRAVVR